MHQDHFLSFLESVNHGDPLVSAVMEAFEAIFESRTLPEVVRVARTAPRLKQHQFQMLKDDGKNREYRVATKDSNGNPLNMLVHFAEFVNGFMMVSFVQEGQHDFNVTGTGSLDAFNSAFGVIKWYKQNMHPPGFAYNPLDKDPVKAAQKGRIYETYFTQMGCEQMPPLPNSKATVFRCPS